MPEKHKLLIPLDGTAFSRRIEPAVQKIFATQDWRVHLLHVARVPVEYPLPAYGPGLVGADYRVYLYAYDMPGSQLHPLYDDDELREFRGELEEDLQREVRLFEGLGYEVEASVDFGDPTDAIVHNAKELEVDAVAMASHHRGGFERFFTGSVARQVLDRLEIPILLLDIDEDEAQEARQETAAQERTGSADGEDDDMVVVAPPQPTRREGN